MELLRGLPEASRHVSEELWLLAFLGFAQALLKGFDSPEAARTHVRIQELLLRMDELPPQLAESLWGIFAYHQLRADFLLCQELAARLVREGERQRGPELLIIGHGMMSIVLTYRGGARDALEHSERALALMRSHPQAYREVLSAEGMAYASIIQSMSGRLGRAREYEREALRLARRFGEPLNLALVMTYLDVACLIRRDVQGAQRLSDAVIAMSGERSHWLWPTWARAIRGWVLAMQGQPRKGLVLTQQQATRWRTQGARGGLTYCYILLAEIHLMLGQLQAGLTVVGEALAEAREAGEHGFEAELRRFEGELLRAMGREREARDAFLRAIAMARAQGAFLFELRATVSLGRLLRDTGRPEAARRRLTRSLARFEVGEDSVDLQEARVLLEELSAGEVPERVP